MVSSLASSSSDSSEHILCYYVNMTTQLQKVAIAGQQPDFERMLFPQQRLLFEANSAAILEVHSCSGNGETSCTYIPCLQLKVQEGHSSTTALATVFHSELPTDQREE